MEMRLCSNNHYYDQSVYASCPYCAANAGGVGKTVASNAYNAGVGKTMPVMPENNAAPQPVPAGAGWRPDGEWSNARIDDDRTRAGIKNEIGSDPVVGWLVCVEGKEKGRDFRIHADNNFIGRDPSMDIVIRNDDSISRNNHAIISYDARDKAYYFAQGGGRGIVRVNGKATLSTTQLSAYDRLEIGETKLVFVPLCGEDFAWLEKK